MSMSILSILIAILVVEALLAAILAGMAQREGRREERREIAQKLHFARSVGKRLDEHRELVESIEETSFFRDRWWHIGHMAVQDDYLMRLYFIVYGCWPEDSTGGRYGPPRMQSTGEIVRPRPHILGPCLLPEYPRQQRQGNENEQIAPAKIERPVERPPSGD
jgi:hypothetical protein